MRLRGMLCFESNFANSKSFCAEDARLSQYSHRERHPEHIVLRAHCWWDSCLSLAPPRKPRREGVCQIFVCASVLFYARRRRSGLKSAVNSHKDKGTRYCNPKVRFVSRNTTRFAPNDGMFYLVLELNHFEIA